ncbi:MAG: hypothetical protein LBQ54_05100 [Planctomycetaceae bacterium]|nr:hypothetical protein [Planctomycetaceae bacterium]
MLIISVILLLIGLELLAVQRVVLTSDATLFLARKTNHPALAAKDSLDALTGSDIQVPPLTVPISVWYGRGALLLSFVIFLKNSK